jgi:hypothetical protein
MLLDEWEMDPGRVEDERGEFVPTRVEADEGQVCPSSCRNLSTGERGFKQRQSP